MADSDWVRRHSKRQGPASSDTGARRVEEKVPTYKEMMRQVFLDHGGPLEDAEWGHMAYVRYREVLSPTAREETLRRRANDLRKDRWCEWRPLPDFRQSPEYLAGDASKRLYETRGGGNLNFRVTDEDGPGSGSSGDPSPTPVVDIRELARQRLERQKQERRNRG